MNILIITGGSKGIGKAIAKKYASKNYKVYSLSRSTVDLENITQISVDLSNLKETESSFKMLLTEFNIEQVSSITLINNAGRIGKISSLENLKTEDIAKTIQLNTITPLVLSSLFISILEKTNCKKQIINISSGAAKTPYQGWSVYCTSKAGIDMMTKTIANEQIAIKNSVKCVSIYPGVVDTNMQTDIRNTQEKDFSSLQRFKDLKENNELYSAEFVAEKIYTIDTKNQLKSGDIVDLRSF
jgi:benzil reductase ((S)-benzoin forming)